ncbi:hypothetical protein JW979_09130 [bacterium]|nr:hypothetical protein [candidate division CSSED10-310 bacterium]
MKFKEMRWIEDIKSAYDTIDKKHRIANENVNKLINRRLDDIIAKTKKDFENFFSDRGFDISHSDETCEAHYRSLLISLKPLAPGRREDDVECIVRFQMIISGVNEELYTIFVRGREDSGIEGREKAEDVGLELKTVCDELTQQITLTENIIANLQKASLEFRNHKNILVIEHLMESITAFKSLVIMDLTKLKNIYRNRLTFLVSRDQESTAGFKSSSYDSFMAFLIALDSNG